MYDPDNPATPAQDYPGEGPCVFCGVAKVEHSQLEAVGGTHHRWSHTRQGGLTVVETNTPGAQPVQGTSVIIAPAPDLALRMLLRDLGVITPEQFDGLR
jgi:hypothetical protein